MPIPYTCVKKIDYDRDKRVHSKASLQLTRMLPKKDEELRNTQNNVKVGL